MAKKIQVLDRRAKARFAIRRELRYKLLENARVMETGAGHSIDIGSGGVAFTTDRVLNDGSFVELSISWPVLLDDTCAMRLAVFGRVLRSEGRRTVCSVDKYEFRTQARAVYSPPPARKDSMLLRWAETIRRGDEKASAAGA